MFLYLALCLVSSAGWFALWRQNGQRADGMAEWHRSMAGGGAQRVVFVADQKQNGLWPWNAAGDEMQVMDQVASANARRREISADACLQHPDEGSKGYARRVRVWHGDSDEGQIHAYPQPLQQGSMVTLLLVLLARFSAKASLPPMLCYGSADTESTHHDLVWS